MAYGSYYNFSLRNFLLGINTELVIWALAFLLVLGLTNYVLRKFFKRQKGLATGVAIIISILTIYWTSKSLYLQGLFSGVGISLAPLAKALPWLLIAISIFIIVKWGFDKLLMIFGLIMILAGIFDWVYERGIVIIIGIILFLIGVWLWRRKSRKKKGRGMVGKDRKRYFKRKKQRLEKWNKAGRNIGDYGSKGIYKTGKKIKKGANKLKAYNRLQKINKIRDQRLKKQEKEQEEARKKQIRIQEKELTQREKFQRRLKKQKEIEQKDFSKKRNKFEESYENEYGE